MAKIVIELPNQLAQNLVAAVCQADGYSHTLENGEQNPVSPQEFMHSRFMGWAKNYLDNYRPIVDVSQVKINME